MREHLPGPPTTLPIKKFDVRSLTDFENNSFICFTAKRSSTYRFRVGAFHVGTLLASVV